jgi:predicted RNA polymerase sigma factor
MLFAICHPAIPLESQIGLALRILCGFGIDEIANAFLTSKETTNKRLFRAREKLRIEKIPIAFPGENEINNRIDAVLTTLYLLFNEGYYSESKEAVVQEELCQEAMRLCRLLIANPRTNTPPVNALMALMCFHASRLKARKGQNGELVLYQNQDETLWNQELITSGAIYLKEASQGTRISKYHFEASIAYWHTIKQDTKEKWENILQLYNQLLQLEYSPIAALNRTYALAKVSGKEVAIIEAEKLKLIDNHFYFMLLGELYKGIDNTKAKAHLERALALAKTSTDKQTIQRSIDLLK